MQIPFTQFLRPDGRKKPVTFDVEDASIEAEQAQRLIDADCEFSCEELMTGTVVLYVSWPAGMSYKDDDMCVELTSNGPEVRDAVSRLLAQGVRELNQIDN